MNIQKKDMKPATSQYYVWHPIANKLNPCNADMILLCNMYVTNMSVTVFTPYLYLSWFMWHIK
jgi:hypothetical protein